MGEMKVEHVLLFLVGSFLVYHMMKGCGCKEGWRNAAGSPTDEHCVLKNSVMEDIRNNSLSHQEELTAKCAEINQPGFRELKGRACRGTSSNPRYRGMDHCKWDDGTCSVDTSSPSWNSLEQASLSELRDKQTKCDSANELFMRNLPGLKCKGNGGDPEWRDVDYCEVRNESGYPWSPSALGQDGSPPLNSTRALV
jgi:hypothetical protein